jgi:hypothetical protein
MSSGAWIPPRGAWGASRAHDGQVVLAMMRQANRCLAMSGVFGADGARRIRCPVCGEKLAAIVARQATNGGRPIREHGLIVRMAFPHQRLARRVLAWQEA